MRPQCQPNLSADRLRTACSNSPPYRVHVAPETPWWPHAIVGGIRLPPHVLAPMPTIICLPHTLGHSDLLLVRAGANLMPMSGHPHSPPLLRGLQLPLLFTCLTQLRAARPEKPSPTVRTSGPRSLPAARPCCGSPGGPPPLDASGVPSSSPLQPVRSCPMRHCTLEETRHLTNSRCSRHCQGHK